MSIRYLLIPQLLFVLQITNGFSQSIPDLKILDTIPSDEEKLNILAPIINSKLYSNPKQIAFYAKVYDSIAKKIDNPEINATALNFKGMAHYVVEEYDRAITYYLKATRILEQLPPSAELASIYNNLAACTLIRNDLEKTEEYYLKSLSVSEAINDRPWIANTNNNLAMLYSQHKLYDKAEAAIKKAIPYYKEVKDSIKLGITYMNYGNAILFSEHFNEATKHYQKAVELVTAKQIPLLHAVSKTGIGISATKNKDYQKALAYLTEGVTIAKAIKHDEQLMESYNALGDYYSATKNYKEAYNMAITAQDLKDSVLSRQQDANMAQALTKFETEKKEAQLKVVTLEAEKAKQQQRLFLILAISGLLFTGLIGYSYQKNKQKNKQLAKQKELLEKTVDEKNTLLRETHHRVKNSFQIVSSLLFLQSKNIKDKEAQLAIKEAQNRVRSMVLIHQKLYSKDELVGIETHEYFQDLLQDIFDSHKEHSNGLKYNLDIESMVLNIETITPIGLILNELIVNVLKHAFTDKNQDGLIRVQFKKEDEHLVLKVIDNGNGLSADKKDSSFGLKLINALAKKLKATFLLRENKERGTEAMLQIRKYDML